MGPLAQLQEASAHAAERPSDHAVPIILTASSGSICAAVYLGSVRIGRGRVTHVRVMLLWVVACAVLLAGCGSAPELRVSGYGNVLDGNRENAPAYFGTQLCFEDEAREVTILGVDVRRSVGDIDGFRFMVDWPGGVDSQPVLSDRQPVPAGYESAVGSTGTATRCEDGNQADLVIVFPQLASAPIGLDGIDVHYEVDGESGVAPGALTLVQCPRGQLGTAADLDTHSEDRYCVEPQRGG